VEYGELLFQYGVIAESGTLDSLLLSLEKSSPEEENSSRAGFRGRPPQRSVKQRTELLIRVTLKEIGLLERFLNSVSRDSIKFWFFPQHPGTEKTHPYEYKPQFPPKNTSGS